MGDYPFIQSDAASIQAFDLTSTLCDSISRGENTIIA